MKIGIVVPIYERVFYLKKMVKALAKTKYNAPREIIFVDDYSSDKEIEKIINIIDEKLIFIKKKNKGIADSLMIGFDYLKKRGCNVFCNIDSDAVMKPEWILKETELLACYPGHIITGFNSNNTKKHWVLAEHEDCYEKRTANGINYMFGEAQYDNVIKSLQYNNAWDQKLCEIMLKEEKKPFISTRPSVVNHIGKISSDTLKHINFDYAEDY